jgi:hypothetical protein
MDKGSEEADTSSAFGWGAAEVYLWVVVARLGSV